MNLLTDREIRELIEELRDARRERDAAVAREATAADLIGQLERERDAAVARRDEYATKAITLGARNVELAAERDALQARLDAVRALCDERDKAFYALAPEFRGIVGGVVETTRVRRAAGAAGVPQPDAEAREENRENRGVGVQEDEQ